MSLISAAGDNLETRSSEMNAAPLFIPSFPMNIAIDQWIFEFN